MKSLLLAVLMVSMSLSVGLVELNKAPWLVEDGESQLEELNNPMHTTAPSISYSSSTLALSNNTAMTPLTVTNSGGTVGIPIADEWGSISQSISMALDSDGYKHVSFYHNTDRDLYYSTDASGVWANVSVDTEGQVGSYESIAVDSEDNVHIAYYSTKNDAGAFTKDLKYATCASSCESSSSWSNITIDATGDVGLQTSIAVDSNDGLHISYLDLDNDELKYATCASSCGSASSWSVVSVDGIGTGVMQAGIAIDSNDDVHIVYTAIPSGTSNYVVKYSTCSSSCSSTSSWTTTTGIHPDVNVKQLSFTIDSNDALHIATLGVTSKEVYYGICATLCTSSSSWSNVSIDSHTSLFFGYNPSISVDSNNNPHIVYRGIDPTGSTSNSALAYATCISSCLSDSSFWSVIAVDGRGGAGWGTAIAVNQGNNSVHMVYAKYDILQADGGDIHYLSTDTAPYSISPDLPKGLSLDWGSGKILGTPTELSSSTTYTITARNSHGSDTTTLTISVNAPPLMSYDWGSGSSDFQSTEYVNNKVSAGRYHTCAIPADGSVKCWGKDDYGQLGNGATTTSNQYEPVNVNLPAGQKAVSVGAGKSHTCALLDTGSVMCWGIDGQGQLGNGATTTTDQDEPVLVNLPTGRTAVEIMVSWDHTCAILDTGALMCWGYGGSGRLGNGETTNAFSPVSVNLPYGRTAVAVSAGRLHTCALLDTGSLMCWGNDGQGQLGDGGTKTNQLSPVYVDLPTGRTAASIAGGREYNCAILDNRSMMCWGDDYNAQLGNGAEASDQLSPAYVDLPLGREAVVITAGDYHACAILDNESTYCWGANNVGQLGIGVTSNTDQNSPVHANITTGRTAVAVSGGEYHTCAILDNSSMTCWGSDTNGELGDGGTGNNQDSPAWVSGNHAWDNTTNLVSSTLRLGQNVTISSLSPTFDAGFGAPTSCTSTGLPPGLLLSNTCVLSGKPTTLGNTTLTITPSNAAGSGLSVSLIVSVYLSVPSISYGWDTGSSDVLSMEYVNNKVGGGGHHTCAIQDDGDLKCWGDDQFGQLGNGASITADQTSPSSTPIDLGTGRTAVAVTTGAGHTCAILDNGDLKCWGSDQRGKLGDGGLNTNAAQPSSTAIDLGTGRTAVAVSAGHSHTCAILDNGDLKCWGRDTEGQLGDGGTNSDQGSPVSVDLGTNRTAVSVSVGDYHTCAILDNGDLKCWGWDNVGQLGDGGTNVNQDSPVSVDLGTGRTAIAISAGNSHTCAILDNGDLKCWGKDSDGQLGYGGSINNLNAPSSTAIDLGTDRTAVGITAGHSHACAILNNSDLKCWGKDNYGQLGDGGTTNQNQGSPASVDLGTSRTAAAVSAGNYHTCAILDNNEAKCWGRDNSGQLGDGGSTTSDQPSPASVSGSHTWDNTTYFVSSTLRLVQNVAMSSLSPISAGSAPTSCTSTGLPPGLSLSNTCVLSGTPTTLDSTTLIITPSNAAGNGLSVGLIVNVNAFGGSLIINTTSTEANQGSAISDITMSYTHTAAIESWVSGVTNSTINPAATIPNGGGSKLSIDSGLNGDIAAVYSVERTGATSANLTLLYKWNGTWTESTIDSSVDTDVASVAIDRQGALHIGYVDKDNAELKYATNATGSWVIDTLGDAAIDLSAHTAISVHPVTNAVHIMAVNGSNNNAGLKHYTNETGTWLNSTISNPSEDEGYGVKADLDSDGNLHVVFRREANSVTTPHYDDLILASRLNGVWQNQTISQSNSEAQGQHFDMAIDSQNQIHVTYQGPLNQGKWIYHGVLSSVNPSSSWVLTQLSTLGFWPALAVDSNDNVHLSYHGGQTTKDQWYQTYTSGTWSSTIETSATSDGSHGAYFNEMTTDSNDDVFIFAYGEVVSTCRDCDIRITMIEGLGPSLATNPIFEVSPELPDGLTMNWRNGTISGTPTEAHANTTHTVTVTAFGATTTETFTLMVLEAPDISYAGSPFTFTKNTEVVGETPTNAGGAVSTWEIHPAASTLPSGLFFGPSNGTIYGTPTAVTSAATFTVWANNSADSNSTTISITVQDEAPDISYLGSPFLWTKGTHTINNPSNDGGSSTSYSVTNGTLPAGIFLPPGSGYLIGTPTAVYATASVTITATNSAGNSSTTVSITVQDEAADISYANSPFTFTKNTEVVGETPTNAGGAVSTWAIHPAASTLPSGLLFGPSNGTIYGTPTAVTSAVTFTVWANNSADSNSTTISITVQDEAADISYANSPFTFTKNTEVVGETPTNAGGAVSTWAIHPAASTLPSGLLFGPSNGTIYGTPTTVTSTATFTVWANNSADDVSTTISITVQDEAADISYANSPFTFTKNDPVSGETPTNSGGVPDGWEITPDISISIPGLSFNPANGVITGTPTAVTSAVMFTVWANNSADDISTTISITVQDEAADISYAGSPFTFTKNDPVSGETPTNVGGVVSTWEIYPVLSSSIPGLSFNSGNGVITGTPTGIHSAITFTVWANNSADDISTTITISVRDEAPSSISYPGSPYTFTKNSIVNAAAPTYTDGAPTSWSIDSYDDLPAGIEFDNATGEITGTPTAVTATVTFTVWGNNSAGDISTTIEMTVDDIAPAFTYPSLEVELTNNSATSFSPISTGGTITSWEFVGTEPNGLNFGPGNGTIWGTPIDVQSKTQYLIWGNNSGGQLSVYLNITISDVPVVFSYAADNYNLTRAEPMATPISPVSNGIVETWEIEPELTGTGLSFDSATGEISGTPIINMTRTQYTVWANNTGGNVSQNFNITINEPRVGLDYSRENEIFVTGTTITPLHPTVTGGMVETWEYEGVLPNGLFFTNGVFTGTPIDVTSQTMLTVWANNTGGAINHTLNFTVNAPGVELDYDPDSSVITIGQPMTALTPIITNGTVADVDIWSIYPELDNGLSFGTSNGTIWGTPTSIQPIQLYKIWANNTGGNSSHDINITILDIVPEISYSLVSVQMTNDTVSSDLPLNPTNLGGPVVTWSITPELSSGLMFDVLTGEISGTPDEVKASEIYTVSATNTGGTDTTQIEITVLDQVPMIAYVPLDEVLLNNSSVLNMVPESTGGAIAQWSITPEPSAGLFFDTSTGILSGTATEIKVRTEYEITATNDVGSMSVKVNVTVEDLDYDLSIGPIYLLINEEMLSIGPTSTLSDSVYEISPDLPDGMFIGASNGTIWGTPTDDMLLTNFTIYANNSLFNDVMVIQIGVLDDSDSDGMPNQLPLDYNPSGGLVEDLDDDSDGFSDAEEVNCATDPLDANSLITDLDGDSICDELDEDIDGDGLLNDVETNSSTYVDQNNTGTDSSNADSDGDGVCDGPEVPANGGCSVGPDAFPFDSAGSIDSDGDGMPDTLNGESTSTPPLVEDLDDDNDNWSDEMEVNCGTDSSVQNSVPGDEDGDGICDALDTILDLPFTMTYPSDTLTLTLGNEISIQLPTVSGLGEVATWEISSELPAGLIFGWSPARDAHLDGSITGTPTEAMDATQFTIWANNSAHGQSFNITISVLEEVIDLEDEDEGDSQFKWGYICFPIIILLLLLIFVLFFPSDKEVILDAEPENTTSRPKFAEGEGTKDNPFVLKPANDVNPGDTIYSEELITITNITPGLKIQSVDYSVQQGERKFTTEDLTYGNEEVRMFEADEEGVIKFQLIFDDSLEPTLGGGEFQGAIKIGRNSVYLIWDVKVKPDPGYVKQQENLESESKKTNAEAEAKAKSMTEAKAEAKAKAKAEAEAKAKTEAETEKLRAKKLEELERVRARAKTIDFSTLGVATIDEQDDLQEIKGIGPFIAEKLNALGIYNFEQVGNMTSKIEEEVNKAIEFFPGRVKRDQWAKQARELHDNKK